MFFIKKLFKFVSSSSEAAPESKIAPTTGPVKKPVDKKEDKRPLVCDNKKSEWAEQGIPENIKPLPLLDIEI